MQRAVLMMLLPVMYSLVIRCFEPVQLNGARTRADDWDAGRYSTNAGFVPELGKNVLDILSPR